MWFRSCEKGTNVPGNIGKIGNSWLQQDKCFHSTHATDNYRKKRFSSFQKYIVFHRYFDDIHLAVIIISPIFPIFPSTLDPFRVNRIMCCLVEDTVIVLFLLILLNFLFFLFHTDRLCRDIIRVVAERIECRHHVSGKNIGRTIYTSR